MASTATPPQQSQPCPLYDLFLDLPHPAASKSCPGPFLIPPPVRNQVADEIDITRIAYFAFPEYDESSPTQQKPNAAGSSNLNQYDVYAMQNESFMQFTFSLQLQTGSRMHGHVRRYLPPHLTARTRYDVGRRGERALVLLTRATGADLLYTSILKYVCCMSRSRSRTEAHGDEPVLFLILLSFAKYYVQDHRSYFVTTSCVVGVRDCSA